MNSRATLGLGIAVTASVVLHAGGIIAASPPEQPLQIEAAAPGVAMLGNSFADMAAGAPSVPDVTNSVTPVTAPVQPVETVSQITAPVVSDMTPTATGTIAVASASSPTLTPAASVPPPLAVSPLVETAPIIDTLVVQTPDASTLRPQKRPANLGEAPPGPTPRPQQQQQADTSGNVAQTARQGTSSGTQGGNTTAASNGTSNATTNQGNAREIANYPSRVMRRISRTRRERVNVSGTAIVTFSLSTSGGLASVSIARSSGNAEIDQVALNHVRRAAPFPAPPQGAQKTFSVEITTR